MSKSSAARKVDPFQTKKSAEASRSGDTVTPPAIIARAIDAFRAAQDQSKHFEGEAAVHKDQVLAFANEEFSKRILNGQGDSFKVLGEESVITYVVMEGSAGLTEEDVAAFSSRWGKRAAEELIVRDLSSVKFDAQVLEANYDAVVAALQKLPEGILKNLFKPMLQKARPGAAELAKKYAKTPSEMKELVKGLKIKNYIR